MRRILMPVLLGAAVPLLALAAPPAAAQQPTAAVLADSVQRQATAAFLRNDANGVRAARMLAERGQALYPNDALLLHQLGYALYREALLVTSSGPADQRSAQDRQALKELLTRAQRTLEQSAGIRALPETYALLSAVFGQQAGNARGVAAMRPGMRAGQEMERALEAGAENPRVWLLRGTNALYTPAMWGGGADKAQQYLERAIQFFERDAARSPLPTWGHAEAYAWLGNIYSRKRDFDRARTAYNAALRLEPQYGWVRTVLLPRLDRSVAAPNGSGN
ncbi:MAG TPA: tetratricopeptide repeat protein [Longimicrobiaceae bacterium]|nr:tetratricopeptide repeat protein [Longimicrobiaceae bacterium]